VNNTLKIMQFTDETYGRTLVQTHLKKWNSNHMIQIYEIIYTRYGRCVLTYCLHLLGLRVVMQKQYERNRLFGSSGQLDIGMGKGKAESRWANGNCGAQP
jgi:hypothetical protein